MSDWSNKKEIMRDLSVAQGRRVPAHLETFRNTAPPAVNIEEETEAAYYKSNGDTDFSVPPDCSLIQEWLFKASTFQFGHEKETSKDDIIVNSEMNPLSPAFVPSSKSDTDIIEKKTKERNVAMRSILNAQATSTPTKQPESRSPINMFKKKTVPKKEKENETVLLSPSGSVTSGGQYVPTALANLYYNKYLSNANLKKHIKKDIWSRLEEQIEEIDERNFRLAVLKSLDTSTQDIGEVSNSSSSSSNYGMDTVSLLHYRHLTVDSPADCVVCQIAGKHGYTFEEE